jgi:hypothetical protein
MENSANNWKKMPREMFYFRQRYKNAVFAKLQSFFCEEAEKNGITKATIATRLNRDPAQITRWLSSPGNLTLDTFSDLLFAMEAEAEPPVIVKLNEQREPNYMNPLIAKIIGRERSSPNPLPVNVKLGTTYQTLTLAGEGAKINVVSGTSPTATQKRPVLSEVAQ